MPKPNQGEQTPKLSELVKDDEILKQAQQRLREKNVDSKNELSEFERIIIAALKNRQQQTEEQSSKNDLESIVDTLKYYSDKMSQAIQLNKVSKTEKKEWSDRFRCNSKRKRTESK